MTDPAATTTNSEPIPGLIAVYGIDQAGKSHASTFKGAEAELAQTAAALMNMRVLALGVGDEQAELAERLPVGRVFASGKAFVPFVKKALYDQLCALGGVPAALPPTAKPRTKVASAKAELADEAEADAEPTLPTGWDTIGPNSLVLATTGPQEGWFEAVVTRAKADSYVVVLRWLDWPDEPQFSRRRNQLALLPGAVAPEPDAAQA